MPLEYIGKTSRLCAIRVLNAFKGIYKPTWEIVESNSRSRLPGGKKVGVVGVEPTRPLLVGGV
jgi:hypothetical protein